MTDILACVLLLVFFAMLFVLMIKSYKEAKAKTEEEEQRRIELLQEIKDIRSCLQIIADYCKRHF